MNLSESAKFGTSGPRPVSRDTADVLSTIQVGVQRFFTALSARRRRAREIDTLYAFSDRELWDLGLGRSDLPAIRNGTFRRD